MNGRIGNIADQFITSFDQEVIRDDQCCTKRTFGDRDLSLRIGVIFNGANDEKSGE